MKKTEQQTTAIVSFNDEVLELPTLLELDDMDLEQVSGGTLLEHPPDCGSYCPGSETGCD